MEKKKKSMAWLWIIIIVVLLAIAAIIYITFFYKNKNVRASESAIDAIGTVTLDSGGLITTADELYNGLTSKEKTKVDNYSVLETAKIEYEELVNKDAADKVDKLIEAIGEVKRSSEKAITSAREGYDSLTHDQKQLVTELDVLEAAEEEFEYLDVKECEAKIDDIQKAIDSPDLLLPAAIALARTSYDSLSPSHQKKVSNYANLEAAEKAYSDYQEKTGELQIKAEREERLANIKEYQKNCQAVTYAQLVSNPDTYKGKKISIRVEIASVEDAKFLKAGTILARPVGGRLDNVITLLDNRSVKEPALSIGMSVTIYGVFDGLKTITSYVDGTGFLGTTLFAQIDTESQIPEINVKYTSDDDEEAINAQPTTTEVFNKIEEGIEIAEDVTEILKKIPWKQ